MNGLTGTVEAQSSPGGLLSGYVPIPGAFDELLTTERGLRPSWQPLVRALELSGSLGLQQRVEQTRRALRENGVTYNVFGAPEGPNRPWELDPIPLLIPRSEWTPLAEGVAQRALLLDRLLADIHGPQSLLRDGVLPAGILFGPSGFLPSCHGLPLPRQRHLHLYGAHLARAVDGTWIALADRTQGPSGAGYALENRLIISRILPNEFQSLQVERLASFFLTLRETLLDLALSHRDNPRVVLLTPGPRSSTYFEDGYLARYLGYNLVEGGDLTVRGQTVYLKTLGGLLPVDVILRRVADEDCDPLELRPDSWQGVPGLVQAVRSRQVAVANALGSGITEAPALLAFLPEICQVLLGEELRLPSIPTWWCGRPSDCRYVVDHLEQLIIRPALRHRAADPIVGWQLTRSQRTELIARIHAQPERFVGQQRLERSTAPVWTEKALQPWRVGLRTFAVASRDGYEVMPGGLSRVSASDSFWGESMAAGEASKDVWVLSDKPVENISLLNPRRAAVELRRSVNDLPSRTADNLFWLGRHLERAEGLVRHLRSIVVRLPNESGTVGVEELRLLILALTDPAPASLTAASPDRDIAPDTSELQGELRAEFMSLVFDEQRPLGLSATTQALRRTAALVRDRLSIDFWRIINQIDLNSLFPWSKAQARAADVLLLLNQLLTLLSAASGLSVESMTRGLGWRFLDMGRRVERALNTLHLVRQTVVEEDAELTPILEAILEIADSTMTYRYRYLTSLQLAPVLDLILLDETNPRAVGFQLSTLADHVRDLAAVDTTLQHQEERRLLLAAQASLRLCDVDAFSERNTDRARAARTRFLDQLSEQLRQLSNTLTEKYLTHTGPSRQLNSTFSF